MVDLSLQTMKGEFTLDMATEILKRWEETNKKNSLIACRVMCAVKDEGLYTQGNYESFEDYTMQVFSIKKSVAYSMAKIGRMLIDEEGRSLVGDFSQTQLEVMLPLISKVDEPQEAVQKITDFTSKYAITPECTVKDVKEFMAEEQGKPKRAPKPKVEDSEIVTDNKPVLFKDLMQYVLGWIPTLRTAELMKLSQMILNEILLRNDTRALKYFDQFMKEIESNVSTEGTEAS